MYSWDSQGKSWVWDSSFCLFLAISFRETGFCWKLLESILLSLSFQVPSYFNFWKVLSLCPGATNLRWDPRDYVSETQQVVLLFLPLCQFSILSQGTSSAIYETAVENKWWNAGNYKNDPFSNFYHYHEPKKRGERGKCFKLFSLLDRQRCWTISFFDATGPKNNIFVRYSLSA